MYLGRLRGPESCPGGPTCDGAKDNREVRAISVLGTGKDTEEISHYSLLFKTFSRPSLKITRKTNRLVISGDSRGSEATSTWTNASTASTPGTLDVFPTACVSVWARGYMSLSTVYHLGPNRRGPVFNNEP